MSMFDKPQDDDQDNDSAMKDMILQHLIDKMESIIGGGLSSRPGMGVEVQADSPEALKDGIEKAGEVVDQVPSMDDNNKIEDEGKAAEAGPESSDDEDLERLKELFGDEGDKEDDEENKFRK